MTTLQEQFEKDFPDKGVGEIDARSEYKDSNFTNYDLDLRGYVDLKKLYLDSNKITSINVLSSLSYLFLHDNNANVSKKKIPDCLMILITFVFDYDLFF